MSATWSFARKLRLRRLYRHAHERLFVVPLDHSVTDGPIGGRVDRLVGELAGNGVDAVVLHKGTARHVNPDWFARLSLIVHLSASTRHAADADAKYLVASVEEALRLGADGVSVHVNLGSAEERRQISDLASVADACDRWNLPLLAMMYPRGPRVTDPRRSELVAHAVTLAADLGADLVKTLSPASAPDLRDITRDCPIPLIVAGGPPRDDLAAVVAYVEESVRAGAAGTGMGRNIFQAADPGAVARAVAAVVHGTFAPVTEPSPSFPSVHEQGVNA
ncbi:2-amino-3,7-dideoxy-D-threo-hept-6-ulosonate synthase [Nonomuraea typhae]|uniref:2-amino-3,7-dideoxy-D-threo-hept-6-ulosonate synthase n=1 Tax=Nonomuraea typhae TaxID=2603600 RepID=A0ABW7YQZ9_9ACTN